MQFVGRGTKAISRRDGKKKVSNCVQNLTVSSVFSSKPMYLEQRIYVTVVKQGSDFPTSLSCNHAPEGLVICMITYSSIPLNLFSIVCTRRILEWHNLLNLV
jgi:hypothetical protein